MAARTVRGECCNTRSVLYWWLFAVMPSDRLVRIPSHMSYFLPNNSQKVIALYIQTISWNFIKKTCYENMWALFIGSTSYLFIYLFTVADLVERDSSAQRLLSELNPSYAIIQFTVSTINHSLENTHINTNPISIIKSSNYINKLRIVWQSVHSTLIKVNNQLKYISYNYLFKIQLNADIYF